MVDTEDIDHASEQRSFHEKNSSEVQNTNGAEQSVSNGDDGEYPTGLRLIFVVAALILAIFLTSLSVSSSSS